MEATMFWKKNKSVNFRQELKKPHLRNGLKHQVEICVQTKIVILIFTNCFNIYHDIRRYIEKWNKHVRKAWTVIVDNKMKLITP